MLTENEIKQLQVYCSSAGVEYYDVELELVDHMAEWVDETMQTKSIRFEAALKQMADSFTKEELMQIVGEKRKLIAQKLNRLFWQALLAYFKFPQIAFTFLLFVIAVYYSDHKNPGLFPAVAMHVMNFIVLTYAWGRASMVRKNKEDLRHSLLCYKVLASFMKYFILPTLIYVTLNFCRIFDAPISQFAYILSIYLFPFFVILCLAFRKVNIDMHHKIRELYPMAFSK